MKTLDFLLILALLLFIIFLLTGNKIKLIDDNNTYKVDEIVNVCVANDTIKGKIVSGHYYTEKSVNKTDSITDVYYTVMYIDKVGVVHELKNIEEKNISKNK